MSTDSPDQPAEPIGAAPGGEPGQPSEEELRAAYEAELSRVTATDIIAQTVVSLINIGARRLGLTGEAQAAGGADSPERDLEQVRDAIDGARALMAILERTIPQELAPLRDALSRLQMAYARDVQPATPDGPAGEPGPGPQAGEPAAGEQPATGGAPGPAESSGRLWVPGR
jgi:hypothetical protein